MAVINNSKVRNFVPKMVPKGDYECKIVKAEEALSKTGREYFKLEVKVTNSIPAGRTFDPEKEINPIGTTMKKMVFFPVDGDGDFFRNRCMEELKDLQLYGNIEPQNPDSFEADECLNKYIGIKVDHGLMNSDDKSSPMVAQVTKFCALEED